ncbi:hypothetical protein ZWY2020_027714 [Hordeum vulgare]|nr:hypothetical protein ZWY2020_027714 [Hordeum vulgare]
MASPPWPPGSSSFHSSEDELASFPSSWFEWAGTGRRLLSPYHSPPPQTLAHGVASASRLPPSASPTSPPPIEPPPPPPADPAPGFAFCPSDSELVSFYLRPRISGKPLPDATKQFLHEADVYATDPASLVAGYLPGPAKAQGESKNWYFFSLVKPRSAQDSRKRRIVGEGKGSWKQERGNDVADAEGRTVGRVEKFTYTPHPKEDKKPPEWLMREFSVEVDQQDGCQPRPVLCLCKIYQSPRFLKSASKNSASAARKRKAAPPDDRPHLSPTSPSAPVRKSKSAADEPSAVKRQLLFPPSNPLSPIPFAPPPLAAPILTAQDDAWAHILADPELNWTLEETSALRPCSMTAAAPTLLGSSHGSQWA